MHDRHLPAIKPLTARSVVLSVLMGYQPPQLPVSALVRAGALFGIAERTTRVALTRLAAEGDVVAESGVYRLSERLARRQARQEDSASPRWKTWDGDWELALVTGPARPQQERVALRKDMVDLRSAELREGVWTRPDNLVRTVGGAVAEQCEFFTLRAPEDPVALARRLWDLPGWAAGARRLDERIGAPGNLAEDFVLIAEVVRHLRIDPCLPAQLLPPDWPGDRLRERYTRFRDEFAHRLREYSSA